MIAFAPVMVLLLGLTFVVQEFLAPWAIDTWFGPAEIFLFLPWVFFFALALAVPFPLMLGFAFLAGFGWDARWQVPGDAPDLPFGTSVLLFAMFGSVLQGVRPLFRRGNWVLPVAMVGLAVLCQLVIQDLFLSFRRGHFEFSAELWLTLLGSSLAAMTLSPVLFWLNSRIARKCGYQLEIEQFTFRRSTYAYQI
jgi:hypothetical protein